MNELRVNDLFDLDPFESSFRNMLRPWRLEGVERAPQIKIDISEQEGNYVVKADIPGVRKEDIDIRIDRNQVTISAEVKKEKEEKKDGRVLRSERQYGYASRSFALATEVDDGKAEAKYLNGVLELTLPKKATSATRKLAIE
jgi:HSP20 family protein